MIQSSDEWGTLYGIGVGPGDPKLVTLKALELLQRAPVVAYPAPRQGESLTRKIVAPHLAARIEKFQEISFPIPVQSERCSAWKAYDQTEMLLGKHLRAGRDVVVLCEGDPFFYGSFIYLFVRMVELFRIEVIAGVSSINACAATLGRPLGVQNDRVCIAPASLPETDLLETILATETCVLIKVGPHINKLRNMLRKANLLYCSSYVEFATMSTQRIFPLESFEGDKAPYFSQILVHRRGHARFLRKK